MKNCAGREQKPDGKPRKYVSAAADPLLFARIRALGYEPVPVRTHGIVAEALSCHPDLFLCRLGIREDAEVVFSPWFSGQDAQAEDRPVRSYPDDARYNAACTGRFFIHNPAVTAPELRLRAEATGMTPVSVRQGYARCSTVIVDERSVITYDKGIALPCEQAGMEVLLISPGHVLLPGYDTGLIGGTSGRVTIRGGRSSAEDAAARHAVLFNGDLDAHPDASGIRAFIQARGLEVITIPEYPLTDIGSVI